MSAIAPASAQAPGPTPPSAHPAHEDRGHLAFAGVLDRLSHSQAKAATSEGASLAARSPDEDRRQAPPAPQSELRTGSIDAALSSLFAAPLNAPAGERPEPVVHAGQPEQVVANPAAAETNRSSSHAPGAAIEQATSARLIAERSFVLPAMANVKITAPGSVAIGGGTYAPAAKAPAAADASVAFPTAAPSATPSAGRPPEEADAMQAALPPATLKGQDSGAAASLDGPSGSRPPGAGPSAGSAGAASMRFGAGTAAGQRRPPGPIRPPLRGGPVLPAKRRLRAAGSTDRHRPPSPLRQYPVAELTAGNSSSAGDHVLPAQASGADPNAASGPPPPVERRARATRRTADRKPPGACRRRCRRPPGEASSASRRRAGPPSRRAAPGHPSNRDVGRTIGADARPATIPRPLGRARRRSDRLSSR